MRKIALLILVLFLAGCGENPNAPYLAFAGGGFVFNYRNAEAFYGFIARPVRTLPEGGVIEAQSPLLTGIVAKHDYKVVLRLIDAQGKEIAQYEQKFHTDVDQSTLPNQPLVVGPGYQQNPDLKPGTLN
ncbi:MAG: hypothetical protein E6G89_05580 [Alphaproteobacteria bacterium]|nr:MAG: hypothetical protein E6G89_05580 [Alphaproteobacteria bacterium]